jgi:hypothetical protein
VGKGRVEWMHSCDQAVWVGEGLGDKYFENRAAQTCFALMNGGGGCFCIVGMWLRWGKAGLSGRVAMVEQHGREVLGTKIPKNRAIQTQFSLTNGGGGSFLHSKNVVDVGKGEVEWVGGCDRVAWAGVGLRVKNPENQTVQRTFTHLLKWVPASLRPNAHQH